MRLKKLSILNFKNIADSSFDFHAGINCFVGDNGAGKTNILDAIYYLSMCKSSLGATDNQIIRHSTDFFMLDAEYQSTDDRIQNVAASYSKSAPKCFKLSGKVYDKLIEHIGRFPVVISSPQDTFLVHESGEERRRYLNGVISQLDSSYLNSVVRYNKVLGERNSLLKNPSSNQEIMEVLDMQLSALGADIYAKRKEFIERLSPQLERYYAYLAQEDCGVELEYSSDLNKASMEDILQENRQRDFVCGHTCGGVHRDDIKMKIGGYPLKKYGSQGQQKSFLVALRLAQYGVLAQSCGVKPILLLDDLFDKLDLNRVSRLLSLTKDDDFGQIFISDCNKNRLEHILSENKLDYTIYNV